MKKSFIITLSLMILGLGFYSCSDKDENEVENLISYSELPEEAQKFLSTYFRGEENVLKVEENIENSGTLYEVNTKDGFEIVFNARGYWQEIDAPSGKTIPVSVLPEPIRQTLSYQYHGYGVVEVNTTGENYHLVLSNNQGGDSLDLTFNQSGEIVSTGEMD